MKNRNLLFIGANDMAEINLSDFYAHNYDRAIFVEASPETYKRLTKNISIHNKKHNTDFRAVNALLTSEEGNKHTFNTFNNEGRSSSIYIANDEVWWFDGVHKDGEIELISTTASAVLRDNYPYFHSRAPEDKGLLEFDLRVDAQGAELEVLKGFGGLLKYVNKLTIEVSLEEIYIGGVLFKDLNKFLIEHDFVLLSEEIPKHGDVKYEKRKL